MYMCPHLVSAVQYPDNVEVTTRGGDDSLVRGSGRCRRWCLNSLGWGWPPGRCG